MSLLQRVAEAVPELISAGEGAKDLVIAPNPNLISTINSAPPYLGIVVFGIVAIMAVITIWHTVKLYRPTILRL